MKTPRPNSPSLKPRPATVAATAGDAMEPLTPNSCGPEHVPPQWAWHFRTLTGLRERLLRAHAEHASEAITPPDAGGIDPADSAQDQRDRDLLWAELGAENDQLFEIDCALQRIREGTYGFCEETGHPIPPERLRAIPWARYCRTTAEQLERRATRPTTLRD